MEIKAIGNNIVRTIKNPFMPKSTSTNPFENNSFSGTPFKGSVLPFADVFQKKINNTNKVSKLKMMSASVIGAVSNFGHKLTQPLVNFARNVKSRINNTVATIKTLPEKFGKIKEVVSEKISEKLSLNLLHKEEISNTPKILDMKHINTKANVSDLKATWLEENRLESIKEAV